MPFLVFLIFRIHYINCRNPWVSNTLGTPKCLSTALNVPALTGERTLHTDRARPAVPGPLDAFQAAFR